MTKASTRPAALWGTSALRILIPLAALAALFAGGAWVYTHVVGRLFFATQSATVLPTKLILALAVLAGAASFFSPCSLAITPAFLTYFAQRDAGDAQPSAGRRRLFAAAAWIAVGILAVSALAGILVGFVGAMVYNVLIYLIPMVGVLFVGLGGMMLLGRSARLASLSRFLPGYRSYQRLLSHATGSTRGELIAFGAAYGAASHTCTLPVIIGMLMLPLAAGNYWLAGGALLIYGIALAGLMLLMLTLGQPAVTAIRRRLGAYLQYAIAVLFLVTGGYLFHYFALNYGASQYIAGGRLPVVRIIEGSPGSASPYTPAVLYIPARKDIALDLTDNIGGCGLVTIFPGLGVDGRTVRALVPVGQTRRIVLRAPKPGRYRYHCSENMFFGEIVAR